MLGLVGKHACKYHCIYVYFFFQWFGGRRPQAKKQKNACGTGEGEGATNERQVHTEDVLENVGTMPKDKGTGRFWNNTWL